MLLGGLARGIGQLDAKAVGDVDHGDLVVDLAVLLGLFQHGDQALGIFAARAQEEEGMLPALGQIGGLVGHRGGGQQRVFVLFVGRPHSQVGARAPGRQHEVDLVLGDQALGGAHGLLGAGAVVVFDDLDGHALVVGLEHDAAGVVDLLDPELVVGRRGHGGAARVDPGLGNGPANTDGLGRLLGQGLAAQTRQGGGCDQTLENKTLVGECHACLLFDGRVSGFFGHRRKVRRKGLVWACTASCLCMQVSVGKH